MRTSNDFMRSVRASWSMVLKMDAMINEESWDAEESSQELVVAEEEEEEEQSTRPGQLAINSQVIYYDSGNVMQQQQIGHDAVFSLFLPDMAGREAVRRENRAAEMAEVREMLFLRETPSDVFSTQEVRDMLFAERPLEQSRRLVGTPMDASAMPMPIWAIGVFVVLGIAALGVIAAGIGRRLPRRVRRR